MIAAESRHPSDAAMAWITSAPPAISRIRGQDVPEENDPVEARAVEHRLARDERFGI